MRILRKLGKADTTPARDAIFQDFSQTADVTLNGEDNEFQDLLQIFMVLFGE